MACNTGLVDIINGKNKKLHPLAAYAAKMLNNVYDDINIKQNNLTYKDNVLSSFFKDKTDEKAKLLVAMTVGLSTIADNAHSLEHTTTDSLINMFGLSENAYINKNVLKRYQNKMLERDLLNNMSKDIADAIGMDLSKDDVDGWNSAAKKKVALGLAQLATKAMVADGLLNESAINFSTVKSDFKLHSKNKDDWQSSSDARNLIAAEEKGTLETKFVGVKSKDKLKSLSDIAKLREEQSGGYALKEALHPTRSTKVRTSPVGYSEFVEKMKIKKSDMTPTDDLIDFAHQLSNVEFFKDEAFSDFVVDNVNDIRDYMGYIQLNKDMTKGADGRIYHESTIQSIISKNREIETEIRDWLNGSQNNSFFFNHDIVRNSRVQMNSDTINPVGSKLHRALLHTGTTAFKIGSNSKEELAFKAGVVQAFGGKVYTKKQVEKDFKALDKILNNIDSFTQIKESLKDQKQFGDEGIDTVKAFHEYQKYKQGGSEFETSLTAEIDATNSGLAHTAIQYGITDPALLKMIGVFMDPKDGFEFNEKSKADFDAYEDAVIGAYTELDESTGRLVKTRELKNIESFLGELFDEDTQTVTHAGRSLMKNPVMVYLYGGSVNSIKKGMAHLVRDKIVGKIEDYLNEKNDEAKAKLKVQIRRDMENMKISNPDSLISKKDKFNDGVISRISKNFDQIQKHFDNRYADVTKYRKTENTLSNVAFNLFNTALKKESARVINEYNEANKDNPKYIKIDDVNELPKDIYNDMMSKVKKLYGPKLPLATNSANYKESISNNNIMTTEKQIKTSSSARNQVHFQNKTSTSRTAKNRLAPAVSAQSVFGIHNVEVETQRKYVKFLHIHDAEVLPIGTMFEQVRNANQSMLETTKQNFVYQNSVLSLIDSIDNFISNVNEDGSKNGLTKDDLFKAIKKSINESKDMFQRDEDFYIGSNFLDNLLEEAVDNIKEMRVNRETLFGSDFILHNYQGLNDGNYVHNDASDTRSIKEQNKIDLAKSIGKARVNSKRFFKPKQKTLQEQYGAKDAVLDLKKMDPGGTIREMFGMSKTKKSVNIPDDDVKNNKSIEDALNTSKKKT